MSKGRIAAEIGAVYVVVAVITGVLTMWPGALARTYGHLALAGTFLFGTLWLARRDSRGASSYGVDLAGVLEPREGDRGLIDSLRSALPEALAELRFALLVAAIVFPPFVLLFCLWHGVSHPFTFQPPPELFDFMLGQLVVVALPEEALFRGYFQTRLGDLLTGRVRLLGVELSPWALVCQALLFALLHFLVGLSPSRLAVFFPGLLFGYLRARRGGIGAAIWVHAFSNLLSELLTRGFL